MISDNQPDLFSNLPAVVSVDPKSISARFQRFHRENPSVYARLVELAWEGIGRGHQRLGMKQLFEVLRWSRDVDTNGEPYKLCNSYTSRYARLIMEQEPGLEGVFVTKGLSYE